MTAPSGLPAIIKTFGNPFLYVEEKPLWESTSMARRALQAPLPYAYQRDIQIKTIVAHRLIIDKLVGLFTKCAVVPPARLSYGGAYAFRSKRTSSQLSAHTWGIAVDIDPANNAQGLKWDGGEVMMHPQIIEIFEGEGWEWGGRWATPDCMHFQYCTSY